MNHPARRAVKAILNNLKDGTFGERYPEALEELHNYKQDMAGDIMRAYGSTEKEIEDVFTK